MASEKLLQELNDQYNFELLSGYYYMGMAAYCSDKNMNGFAHFLIEQAKEEYLHSMKFYDFIYDIPYSTQQNKNQKSIIKKYLDNIIKFITSKEKFF